MSKKSNDYTVSLRLNQVEEWLSDGLSTWEIVQNGSQKWNISRRQIGKYIAKAKEQWKEIREKESKHFLEEAEAIRKRLYRRCLAVKDHRTALATRDSLDKIRGILREREIPFMLNLDANKLPSKTKERLDKELSIIFGKEKEEKK
jgi:hypothetical protein